MINKKVAAGEIGVNVNFLGSHILLQTIEDNKLVRVALTPIEVMELIEDLKKCMLRLESKEND